MEEIQTETVFLVFTETPQNVTVRGMDGGVQGTLMRGWECVGVPPGAECNSEMEAIAYCANAMSRKGRYLAVRGEAFTVGLGVVTPESILEANRRKQLEQTNDALGERIKQLERELGIGADIEDTEGTAE